MFKQIKTNSWLQYTRITRMERVRGNHREHDYLILKKIKRSSSPDISRMQQMFNHESPSSIHASVLKESN